jgi:Rps23 Pro-64 3,4-dihydroxylase Tpa1-like proline 4-hydroxylase
MILFYHLEILQLLAAVVSSRCGIVAFTTPLPTNRPVVSSTTAQNGLKRGSGMTSGGFGNNAVGMDTKKKGMKKKSSKPPSYQLPSGTNIQNVLNPYIFNDPNTIGKIKAQIRNGEICVIRNVFISEFADAMYEALDNTDTWSKNEDYFNDGYGFKHNNIYSKADFSPLFLQANEMFETEETKAFMSELTGRDCSGESVGAPSYYEIGDHSLPHTDHIGQRSVAYIWHLSKNWKAEYGGGLYWAPEHLANAYLHASFNTLVLFSVTPFSSHFVTSVSPKSKGNKRLAYNGWWHSSWVPKPTDPLEEMLCSTAQRLTLTHAQIQSINDMLDDPWAPRIQPPERHDQIVELRKSIMEELYPKAKSSPVVLN